MIIAVLGRTREIYGKTGALPKLVPHVREVEKTAAAQISKVAKNALTFVRVTISGYSTTGFGPCKSHAWET